MTDTPPFLEVGIAEPAEHPAIAELTVAAFQLLGEGLGDYVHVLRDVGTRAASADVLVARSGGRVVGAVTYVPGPESDYAEFEDPHAAGVRFLAVAPDAQGRGAGGALLGACLERASAAGRARVLLHSTPVMEVARAMYERAGFVRDPEMDLTVDNGVELLGYRYEL